MRSEIPYDDMFRFMVSAGCIPLIKQIIENYEKTEDSSLYETMLEIGKVVVNYQKFFNTGTPFDEIRGE